MAKPDIRLVEPGDPTDIFNDLAELRRQSSNTAKVKTVTTTIRVERPPNSAFFRVHPSEEMMLDGAGIVIDADRNAYFVKPVMINHPAIARRVRRVTLVVTIAWPGSLIGLWPQITERSVGGWKTERIALEMAQAQWVQLVWNSDKRDFDLVVAEGNLPDPDWPADLSLSELLRLGFADRVIHSPDQAFVRQLRGLAD
jgi:hypothetical protein